MRLIENVSIEGFRSLRKANIEQLGNFTVLAGLNNAGKSNALRALNAFFNAQTDPGTALDVDLDYYRRHIKSKKKKLIRVTVSFSLPGQFKFRKRLEQVQEFLVSPRFSITKQWDRDHPEPSYFLNGKPVDLNDKQKIDHFLQLINFRYIPNRVVPVQIIKEEHKALRDVLVRRLSRKAKEHQVAFETISQTSQRLISGLAAHLEKACPDVGTVRLATPTSWSDMAFAFGYRFARDGVELEDTVQGAGIQSLLMLETLALIDRDYFQKFGWKQAAIWAMEEPESSLHSSLEAQVGAYLAAISSEPSSRLQVLCTTHSDIMVQYADRTTVAEQSNAGTRFRTVSDPRRALEQLSRAGVSRWVHPILYYPSDAVIIVDGKFDHAFWAEALKLIRVKKPVVVTYLEMIDPSSGTGGKQSTYKYIKANMQAIRSRRKEAPVAVVLDWEDQEESHRYARLFGPADPCEVFCWAEQQANPKLTESFRGTERFYSDRIIQEARRKGLEVAEYDDGRLTVEKDHYNERGKNIICDVVERGLVDDDLQYARAFMEEVLRRIGAL